MVIWTQNVFSDDSPWNIFKISDKKLAEGKFVLNQKIKNGNFSQFCEFRGQEIFLFSFPGTAPVIFHWISKVYATVPLLKKYLASKF